MKILIIDTSTERGVAAIFEDEKILYQLTIPYGLNNSKYLLAGLDEAFKVLNVKPGDLSVIGAGIGPGSYTGIRVGVIAAKTLAYALSIPLVAFSTLEAFVSEGAAAIIDAKIGGFYVQRMQDKDPAIKSIEELGEYLKGIQLLKSPNISQVQRKLDEYYPHQWIVEEISPDLVKLARIAIDKHARSDFSDINQLQLNYLRKTQAEIEKDNRPLA